MTRHQEYVSTINNAKAKKYFEELGLLPKDRGIHDYVLHHVDPDLKYNNVERYIEWNPEDLVVMTRSEHTRFHHSGENNYMYGKHWSEEERLKRSIAEKGVPKTKEHREKIAKGRSKQVMCINTGEIFYNATECAKKVGLCIACISESCNHGKSYKGLSFKYLKEYGTNKNNNLQIDKS